MANDEATATALRNIDRYGDVVGTTDDTPMIRLLRHRVTAEGWAVNVGEDRRLRLTRWGRERAYSQPVERGVVVSLAERRARRA